MSVCLSVCPLASLKNDTSKLHEIFCTHYLWSWLGPPLTTMQHVITSGLWMTSYLPIISEAKDTLIGRIIMMRTIALLLVVL